MNKIIISFIVISLLAAAPMLLAQGRPSSESLVALVGDSLTAWGHWRRYFPGIPVLNFGVAGDTSGDIRRRLNPVMDARPSKIFIMAGANDLWSGREPGHVAANMDEIVEVLKAGCPEAKIFIQSMLPANNQLLGPGIDRRDVADLNKRLQALARKYQVTYIDLTAAMADETGQLKEAFTVDGVHLTRRGYDAWQAVIRPYMEGD